MFFFLKQVTSSEITKQKIFFDSAELLNNELSFNFFSENSPPFRNCKRNRNSNQIKKENVLSCFAFEIIVALSVFPFSFLFESGKSHETVCGGHCTASHDVVVINCVHSYSNVIKNSIGSSVFRRMLNYCRFNCDVRTKQEQKQWERKRQRRRKKIVVWMPREFNIVRSLPFKLRIASKFSFVGLRMPLNRFSWPPLQWISNFGCEKCRCLHLMLTA